MDGVDALSVHIPGGWWGSHGGSAQGGREGERPKCAQGEKEDARAHYAGLCAVAAAAVEQSDDDDASPSPGSRRWLVPPVPAAWEQDDKRVLALDLYVVWVGGLSGRVDHFTGVNGEGQGYGGAPSESHIARRLDETHSEDPDQVKLNHK